MQQRFVTTGTESWHQRQRAERPPESGRVAMIVRPRVGNSVRAGRRGFSAFSSSMGSLANFEQFFMLVTFFDKFEDKIITL